MNDNNSRRDPRNLHVSELTQEELIQRWKHRQESCTSTDVGLAVSHAIQSCLNDIAEWFKARQ